MCVNIVKSLICFVCKVHKYQFCLMVFLFLLQKKYYILNKAINNTINCIFYLIIATFCVNFK